MASGSARARRRNPEIHQLAAANRRWHRPILRALTRQGLSLAHGRNDRHEWDYLDDRDGGRDLHGKGFLTNDSEETLTLP